MKKCESALLKAIMDNVPHRTQEEYLRDIDAALLRMRHRMISGLRELTRKELEVLCVRFGVEIAGQSSDVLIEKVVDSRSSSTHLESDSSSET